MIIKQKYYIYALIDQRDNKVFYIGKGSNNRYRQHKWSFKRRGYHKENPKMSNLIKKIYKEGSDFTESILFYFHDENICLDTEQYLIKEYKRINGDKICNIAASDKSLTIKEKLLRKQELQGLHGKSKFRIEDILWIRNNNIPTLDIAKKFNVHISTVKKIRHGEIWKWVGGKIWTKWDMKNLRRKSLRKNYKVHFNSNLLEKDIIFIRNSNLSTKELMLKYNTTETVIWNTRSGKSHKNIGGKIWSKDEIEKMRRESISKNSPKIRKKRKK